MVFKFTFSILIGGSPIPFGDQTSESWPSYESCVSRLGDKALSLNWQLVEENRQAQLTHPGHPTISYTMSDCKPVISSKPRLNMPYRTLKPIKMANPIQ